MENDEISSYQSSLPIADWGKDSLVQRKKCLHNPIGVQLEYCIMEFVKVRETPTKTRWVRHPADKQN